MCFNKCNTSHGRVFQCPLCYAVIKFILQGRDLHVDKFAFSFEKCINTRNYSLNTRASSRHLIVRHVTVRRIRIYRVM
jgi:hypothetical protein